MTLKELSQYYHLNREIEMDRLRLRELERQASSRSPDIDELKEIIEDKRKRCLCERIRLERYISGIDDSLIRQIFARRFIKGQSWRQVAAGIGGGNTADGCRMAAMRYLAKK